jgi:plasmid maintenance system antidote protein VapI
MARKRSTPPRQLSHHWYLAEWAEVLEKSQADAVRELGWAKATASALWNGKQRYTQDLVDEVSAWFNIRPYELLMHPAEAMSLRQVRESAARIATIQGVPTERTGTAG